MEITAKELIMLSEMFKDPMELNSFLIEMNKWEFAPEDTPDRHKDYLPLNLWDETKDE